MARFDSQSIKTINDVMADRADRHKFVRNHNRRTNIKEQLPDWAKNGPKKTSSAADSQELSRLNEQLDAQMAGFELYKRLRNAVELAQTLDDSDIQAIRNNLAQPNGRGDMSVDAPKLFEQYCQQHNLQFQKN